MKWPSLRREGPAGRRELGRYPPWRVAELRSSRVWREPADGPGRSAGDDPYYAFVNDLRLSDWGMKVHIKPPPADQTVPSEEPHD